MSVPDFKSIPGDFARGATVLGRYVIDRCLRRERLASVYAARDHSGLWVSLWAARRDQITRGADASDRFVRTLTDVASITHPSLPALLAWDLAFDTPIVVSTLVPGRTLRDMITSDGFVAIDDVTRITSAIASALQVLHGTSPPIAHGGVSPERVQLSDDGRVWIEEGGYLHALVSSGLLTPSQGVAYAPTGYAPPSERVGHLDAHTDVFQLAVLAFEALTGQLPFGASQPSEVSAILAGDGPPTPSSLRLGLTHELDEFFLSTWRMGQRGAAPSAEAFAREFVRLLTEDRSRRPTFPSSPSSRLRTLEPQRASLAGRVGSEASALDTVDRAFDAMLGNVEEPSAPPNAQPSQPPVIEFTPLDVSVHAFPSAIDVTSVKPTLVGAAPVDAPPADRPLVSDHPTPSVGYERLKLLATDAVRDFEAPVEPPPSQASPPMPDATSRIEDEVLHVLRKTTLARRTGSRPREVPRAPGTPTRSSVPLPPDAATRPSASQMALGRKRKTSDPPKESAVPSHDTAALDATVIPKAPRLPVEVRSMEPYERSPQPSFSPAATVVHEPLDEVAVVATQDILDADLPEDPEGSSKSKPSAPPKRPRTAPSSAESTQLTGTPLPPTLARSQRPPPVPEAPTSQRPPPVPEVPTSQRPPPVPEVPTSQRPPPAPEVPTSQRPPPELDPIQPSAAMPLVASSAEKALHAEGTEAHAPPSSKPPGAHRPHPPTERTGLVQTLRPSQVPPTPMETSWTVAAKWCAVSTVVSALLVTGGFAYLREAHHALLEELRLARERPLHPSVAVDAAPIAPQEPQEENDAPAAVSPDATLGEGAPDVVPTVVDANVSPLEDTPDAAAMRDGPRRPSDTGNAEQGSTPSAEGVPDAATRARLSGAMRGAISDCVEGVEDPPFVVVGVRYDGRTGAVTRVRLHGVFAEAPIAPCIEQAVREVRAPPFAAPSWETEYRFPVPQPRWRPGQPR
jgi:hypothetical protein